MDTFLSLISIKYIRSREIALLSFSLQGEGELTIDEEMEREKKIVITATISMRRLVKLIILLPLYSLSLCL